jgi:hypothetical protein
MDSALIAAAIGVGGTVIVGVAGFWANVRNTNKTTELALQGQVTDRFSKAIDHLGSEKLDVRIGGIYALERIARDSPQDHPTIMEVLAAFILDHSREQWPPAEDGAEPPGHSTRPDVQAAATVIGRRTVQYDSQSINLDFANLDGANLRSAHLAGAHLGFADLRDADLTGADLRGAGITDADLTGAYLTRADLTGADLSGAQFGVADLAGAHLGGAHLDGANLRDADLTDADLRGAGITGADLTGANLTDADLTDADLTGANLSDAQFASADLTRARWPSDTPAPQGWQRNPESGRLEKAAGNSADAAAE